MKRNTQAALSGLLIGALALRVLRRGRARRNVEPGEPAVQPVVPGRADVDVQNEPEGDRGTAPSSPWLRDRVAYWPRIASLQMWRLSKRISRVLRQSRGQLPSPWYFNRTSTFVLRKCFWHC